jgi:type IV pilus assembly protein PilW
MIGLTLGIIGMLIVAQVLSVSGGYQASIAAAGEAQSIGNLSLYTIERDLKQAGFGIASPTLLGCQLTGYDTTRSTTISQRLYPVAIVPPAAANDSDTITNAYGTSDNRMGLIYLIAAYNGTDADIKVANRFGLVVGDFFLLGQITTPATPCIMGQVSALPTADITAVSHLSGAAYRYNKGGGLGQAFIANDVGEFYDLGKAFNFNTYSVNANKELVQQSVLTGNSLVIAENVMAFKARYGHDATGNGTIDTWDTTIPTTSAGWAATTNIRMGLAVRNPQREAGLVTASPLTLWPNGPTITLSADDQHYRYRTYNVVVPLRNMIWRTF